MNPFPTKIRTLLLLCLMPVCLTGCSSDSGEEGGMPAGVTGDLYGYVKDTAGAPVQGVVISDGYTCTATDAEGFYSLTRNTSAYYVYYSVPADCRVEVDERGLPLFYQKLTKSQKQYDFTLTRQAKETRFRMLAIGDPQVTSTAQVYRFENETVSDIRAYIASRPDDLPTYAITLGDIVGNHWELFPNMVKAMDRAKASVPVFQTIGNHDHEYPQTNNIASQRTYESYFGPVNYSFTRGDVHFVSMDNVIHKATASADYDGGFLDWQYEWIKQDLSYVPKDKTVVLCVHIPFRNGFSAGDGVYYNEMLELLSQYDRAHVFAGHVHCNKVEFTHTVNSKKIREYIPGAACGAWWHGTVCTDGTPNGYGVFEFDGGRLANTILKPTRYDETFQLRLYNASDIFTGGGSTNYKFAVTGKNQIIANIWNADDSWRFEVYENGVKTADGLKKVTSRDAWSTAYFYGFCKLTASAYGGTNQHTYYYTKQNADATVRIVAYDGYGNVFEQSEITTPAASDYPDAY